MKTLVQILKLFEVLHERLEIKTDPIKTAYIKQRFNELYDNKKRPFEPTNMSLARKAYTQARYLSRYYKIGGENEFK